jgi:NADH-quinone oxidoreductase subunit C
MIKEISSELWLATHADLANEGLVRFEYLTAAHNGGQDFEVFTKVSSSDLTKSVLVKTNVNRAIETLTHIYPMAKFHEQETWQMFGLEFIGHLNIEKAFSPDFAGHPLRRDFALVTRQVTNWPGAVEPDEKARRRPSLPPGVHESWTK